MLVYAIRHGESENNLKGLWTGWFNAQLTDKGREDAKRAGTFLADLNFDKIYASDLDRAKETAQTAIPGCSYEVSELLREIDVGNLAARPLSVLTDEDKVRIASEGYGFFGGESNEAFRGRIREFMEKLEGLECERVAIFSHAGWIRFFLDEIVGLYLPRKHILCGNCAIAVFQYEKAIWRLHSWINLD